MRYELKAKSDVNRRIGDRIFSTAAGETIELSATGAEIALSELMGGVYEVVREIPDTDTEKEAEKTAAAAAKELAKLKATPKEKLIKQAEKLDIADASTLNKDPLVDAIQSAQASQTTAHPTQTQTTATDGTAQPATFPTAVAGVK